ncbi:hypothetical protein [Pseudokineococcus sp. 1T1Z-3]|uniref:hypothetical protein n=1 Tax=Pseudokineococcus sp. 1T1Z-3 TaxID=3132745 RepID=UPI0030AB2B1C
MSTRADGCWTPSRAARGAVTTSYHVALDRPICTGGVSTGRSRRGAAHELRIRANAADEPVQVIRLVIGACE